MNVHQSKSMRLLGSISVLLISEAANSQMVFGQWPGLDGSYFAPINQVLLEYKSADSAGENPRQGWPLWFEAHLAPHVFFYSGIERLILVDGWAGGAWFTPRFTLRMLNTGDDAPVRTTSFNPELGFGFAKQFLDTGDDSLADWELWRLTHSVFIGHLSNGEEGNAKLGSGPNLFDGSFAAQLYTKYRFGFPLERSERTVPTATSKGRFETGHT